MASVYSVQMIAEQGLRTSATLDVPEGYVWVVRDIELYWNLVSAPVTQVHVIGDNSATFFFNQFTVVDAQRWGSFTGRVVVHDAMTVTVSGDPVDVTISGYQLALP